MLRVAEPPVRDHVALLDDLVTIPDGRLALLMRQVTGCRLTDVLDSRAADLSLGEAVTVLAPLALAVDGAHVCGVTGLSLTPEAVRLTASGAPVIIRVQDAVAGPVLPERFRALESTYLADLAALERLGATVAASLSEPDRGVLCAALRSSASGGPLVHKLFDLAEPLPVYPHDSGPTSWPSSVSVTPAGHEATRERIRVTEPGSDPVPMAPDPYSPSEDGDSRVDTRSIRDTVSDTLATLGIPQPIVSAIRSALDGVVRVVAQGAGRLGAGVGAGAGAGAGTRTRHHGANVARAIVRPRFAVAGVAGLASLLVAMLLVAGTGSDAPSSGSRQSDAIEIPAIAPTELGSSESDSSVRSDRGSLEQPTAPEDIEHPEPQQWAAIVETLVARWLDCRAHSQADCAQAVVHAGSAAQRLLSDTDTRHLLLENWYATGGTSVVIERMGGAVLVDLVQAETTTASLLLVRSEAGWRVRDVID